jgi:hypothetical protein
VDSSAPRSAARHRASRQGGRARRGPGRRASGRRLSAGLVGLVLLGGALGSATGAAAGPPDGADRPRLTRFVYLVPADRPVRDEFVAAIDGGARQLQSWFAGQLGGPTFRTSSNPVEVCRSGRPAADFAVHPWSQVTAELSVCVPWQYDDPHFRWVVYADVPSACGDPQRIGGTRRGVTILGEQELQGLAGAVETIDPCGVVATDPAGRWIGGLGHEFGHSLGLPHSEGCDDGLPWCDTDSIMWTGYVEWPATYLGESEREALADNPFLGDPGPWTPDAPTSLVVLEGARGGPDLRADQILVTWQAPVDDGGSPLRAFRITATPPLPGGPALAAAGDRSVVLSGAAGGVTYTVVVEALNAAGTGRPSVPSSPVTLPLVIGDASGVTVPHGYWMLDAAGGVYPFGSVQSHAPPVTVANGHRAVDLAPTATGLGYWIVDDAGVVEPRGDAIPYGSLDPALLDPDERVASISATPTGTGYWLFTNRGRVHHFGAAADLGDLSKVILNGDVIDTIATPSGHGYYMVAGDGGIFAFGDAAFHGSLGSVHLNEPVVSLVPSPSGLGYWLVARDGGVFAFGDAPYRGSVPAVLPAGHGLNAPVAGMVRYADGYLLAAQDGGIFNFSSGSFYGSLGSSPPQSPITAVAAS